MIITYQDVKLLIFCQFIKSLLDVRRCIYNLRFAEHVFFYIFIISYFSFVGGYHVVLNKILSLGGGQQNFMDYMRNSHSVQALYGRKISASVKKLLEKDRLRHDQDGVVLENFAPYGNDSALFYYYYYILL